MSAKVENFIGQGMVAMAVIMWIIWWWG